MGVKIFVGLLLALLWLRKRRRDFSALISFRTETALFREWWAFSALWGQVRLDRADVWEQPGLRERRWGLQAKPAQVAELVVPEP